MKVLSVVGARPQFVKLAPIAHALAEQKDMTHVIVHTGQHYDDAMSDVFFRDLRIPQPDVHLNVGSASHGAQTGAMLTSVEVVLESERPDWVLVYGDTNSTLAAAIAAVKMHLPLAHLEAGLRSFNRRMPEEHNRVLTDHAADLLLAPSEIAMMHLDAEGLRDRAVNIGDVMTDVCLRTRDAVRGLGPVVPSGVPAGEQFVVATIHRPDNTDVEARLRAIMESLGSLPLPVLLLAHPRLVARAAAFGIPLTGNSLHQMAPMPYAEMVATIMGSMSVVTDSGGLQKEAFLLGVPCTTLRTETEWTETLVDGWNVLDPELTQLPALAARPRPSGPQSMPYGDGHAAARAVAALERGLRAR